MIVKEKNSEIKAAIEKAAIRALYNRLSKIGEDIKKDIKDFNLTLWKDTDTYQSLISGQLTHEFGFPKGTAKTSVDWVLNEISRSVRVLYKLPRNLRGKKQILEINVLFKSISQEIFASEHANVDIGGTAFNDISNDFADFGAKPLTKTLPWLRWLLYEGNNYLVFNYRYEDVISDRSRSGKGLMVRDNTEDWQVPSKYSGTYNSNWLIRTLLAKQDVVEKKYTQIIKKYLKNL